MGVSTEMEIASLLDLTYFAMSRTFKVCNSMVSRELICVLKQMRAHWEANDTLPYSSQMFKILLAIGTGTISPVMCLDTFPVSLSRV